MCCLCVAMVLFLCQESVLFFFPGGLCSPLDITPLLEATLLPRDGCGMQAFLSQQSTVLSLGRIITYRLRALNPTAGKDRSELGLHSGLSAPHMFWGE
jgi:hypothetical protein